MMSSPPPAGSGRWLLTAATCLQNLQVVGVPSVSGALHDAEGAAAALIGASARFQRMPQFLRRGADAMRLLGGVDVPASAIAAASALARPARVPRASPTLTLAATFADGPQTRSSQDIHLLHPLGMTRRRSSCPPAARARAPNAAGVAGGQLVGVQLHVSSCTCRGLVSRRSSSALLAFVPLTPAVSTGTASRSRRDATRAWWTPWPLPARAPLTCILSARARRANKTVVTRGFLRFMVG